MSIFFDSIAVALVETGIKPILIGGWAVNRLGHPRNTLDLDLMIPENKKEELDQSLERLGFKMIFRNPELFAKYRHSTEKVFELDILFIDESTFKKLEIGSSDIKLGKINCFLPSPMALIAMKLHSLKNNFKNRFPKDFPDIIALIDIHGIDTHSEIFKNHCLQFGTYETYELILKTQ